jgi:hypothetical protein
MTQPTLTQSQVHTRFMKHAVDKIQSQLCNVGVQLESGFQVCIENRLRNLVTDQLSHQQLNSRLDVKGLYATFRLASNVIQPDVFKMAIFPTSVLLDSIAETECRVWTERG